MAPTRGRLKGIYPERKKKKVSSKSSSPKQKSKSSQQACQGDADSGEYTAEEQELRQFDMDMSYGPCIGVTRLQRWERAAAMGLRPPPHLRDLILRPQHHGGGGGGSSSPLLPKSKSDGRNGDGMVVVSQLECIWAGKV